MWKRIIRIFLWFSLFLTNLWASTLEGVTDEWLRNFESEMRLNIRSLRQRSYKQPSLWGEEIDRNLVQLRSAGTQDQVRAIFNTAVLFSSDDHGVSDSFGSYQTQLDIFIQGENPLLRQCALLAKAMLLNKQDSFLSDVPARLEETRRLLRECSEHPVFDWIRFMSYKIESDDLRDNKQSAEAYQLWKRSFDNLPDCYHLWLMLHLTEVQSYYCWEVDSTCNTERVENLKLVINDGNPEQQAWAYEQLVDIYSYAGAYCQSQERNSFYNPVEAFRITQLVLETPDLLRFRSVEGVQLSVARLKYYGSDDVKDEEGALEIYEEILDKKGEIDKWLYSCVLYDTIRLLSCSAKLSLEKAKRAVELAEEVLRDPSFHESALYHALSSLSSLYRRNIKGFRDIKKAREYQKRVMSEIRAADPETDMHRLADLYRLMLDESAPDFENGRIICRQILTHSAFTPNIFYSLKSEHDGIKLHPLSAKIVIDVLLENESLSSVVLEELACFLQNDRADMETALKAKTALLHTLKQTTIADKTRITALTALSDLYRDQPEVIKPEEAVWAYTRVATTEGVCSDKRKDAVKRLFHVYVGLGRLTESDRLEYCEPLLSSSLLVGGIGALREGLLFLEQNPGSMVVERF